MRGFNIDLFQISVGFFLQIIMRSLFGKNGNLLIYFCDVKRML